ncbi:Bifunctional inhibitor/lipid-transfer protein/seed storage 2S albumin superfamily protein [Raphanus sativus]|uniref:Non-specific lipid transfer protein GPI-anchored 20-like n=1 Tax=Raphanus sativus TaxID=3726 RepID=A0A6J0NQ13_RAPSA|nr:non-specific lipid transfer protein GPI-anchored 20-like [Raphanus sativus]KAJ4894310.1 Bifunctional inhibitor/lipid-transfer protein/seed storage 2S albumin superfamily protein [Raphanus sativus]
MSKNPVITVIVALLAVLAFPVRSQQLPLSQCTPSMMTTVGPCMSFLTNSTSNGTSPSSDCCNSLRSLTTGGVGCLCLIVTGSVPFNIPINRTTAVSLPRACNMPSVPLQCKANIAPAAAPGPAGTSGPAMSPGPATTPIVPEPTPAAQTPQSDTTLPLTPTVDGATPRDDDGGSTSGPSSLTPSSAYALSPSLLFFGISLLLLKLY